MQEKKTPQVNEPPAYAVKNLPNSEEKVPQINEKNSISNIPIDRGQASGFTTQVGVSSDNPQKKKLLKPLLLFFSILTLVILGFVIVKLRGDGTPTFLGNEGEIVWWGIQHDAGVYQSLIEEFERENPNIKVKYERQSTTDYQVRLMSALAVGTGPDIFEIHNTWVPTFRNNLSTLPVSVMSKDEYVSSFYQVIVNNLSLEKGVIGIPLEYDAVTLFINDDVFTSALKSPPEKWDDVQNLAVVLTQKGSDGKIIQGGVALGITENVDHWQEVLGLLLFQNGVNPAKPTGTFAAQAISFYKSFGGNKYWNNTLPTSTLAFARGELAMYFGPTRRASEIVRVNPSLKFRTVTLPQLIKDSPEVPDFSYATYWFQGVSEKSKVKEGSWNFLKFLSREDSLVKLNKNIESAETFGRIYPRPNMNADLIQHQIFGSVVTLVNNARFWYLAGNTYDGPNGINTQVNDAYERVIQNQGSLEKLPQEVSSILGKFGVSTR